MNRTCCKCGECKPAEQFHRRADRPQQSLSVCKDCQRESWRAWNTKRRGTQGYQRGHYTTPQEAPERVFELAQNMTPGVEGVRVYRLPDGSIGYWIGAMKAPVGSEFVGVYDFDCEPEWVAEDLGVAA